MKLYGGVTSPFVRHCRIALIQENFEFQFLEVDGKTIAQQSPTNKIPYFTDGQLTLSDSSSIVKYIREKAEKSFLTDIEDYESFAMTNTLIDSALNVFILENGGFDSGQIKYMEKQNSRIENGLTELNQRIDPSSGIELDSALRCACFIGWALFRNRFDIDNHRNLQLLMEAANQTDVFRSTAPFDPT